MQPSTGPIWKDFSLAGANAIAMALLLIHVLPSKRCSRSVCFVSAIAALLLLVAVLLSVTTTYDDGGFFFVTSSRGIAPFRRRQSSSSSAAAAAACDIFRGEWVPDPQAPYYTNDTCAVIHEHYDCMKYGRPDLGFARWRWRPDGCELPRLDPARFLEVMRGKTIAFVGDSIARNHMQSLVCLLTRVAQPMDRKKATHTEYHYGGYNLSIVNFWAPFLVRHEEIEQDGPAHMGLFNLYLDEPDAVWAARVPGFDYAVVSASNWFYRPAMLHIAGELVGCYYCALAPNVTPTRPLTAAHALRMATRAALRAVDGADGRFRGTAVLRTLTPSQYEGGAWNGGGDCRRAQPYRRGENRLQDVELDFHRVQLEEFAAAKERATTTSAVRMILMDTTEAMVMRADAHPGKYRGWTPERYFKVSRDCVHWCLPGAIDAWNDMLLHMLTSS